MQIVQGDEKPIIENTSVREGTLNRRFVLAGEPGSPGNFRLAIAYQYGDFYSPRHRHNFDQYRFLLEGESDFERNGTLTPGILGYFPEGTYYGPQKSRKPNVTAVLQFGGPSGSGYLSTKEVTAAAAEMKAFGVFEKGVFRRNAGEPGKPAMDAFQATWEHVNGRPMDYPPAQYADPIFMDSNAHRWMPLAGVAGVEEKALGTFTDCKLRCGRYKIDPGATFTASGRGAYLVLSGAGEVGGQPMRALTAVYLDTGERASFSATETTDVLLMGLPEVARMKTWLPALEARATAAPPAR
jgi:hypothetical protein